MIVADTSGLLALFDASERSHADVRAIVAEERDPLIVSPYVVAELDYLVATRVGVAAELEVLRELSSGAYELGSFDADDIRRAIALIERYGDQEIGIADASIVVLADRFSTRSVLTLDRRHFEVLRPLRGGRFRCMP